MLRRRASQPTGLLLPQCAEVFGAGSSKALLTWKGKELDVRHH